MNEVKFVSYPCTGSSWVYKHIAGALYFKLDETNKELLRLEGAPQMILQAEGFPEWESTHEESGLRDSTGLLWPYERLEQAMKDRKREGEWEKHFVWFMVRDPRDVLLCYYFLDAKRDPAPGTRFGGTIHDWIRDDRSGIKKILTFYKLWWENKDFFAGFDYLVYEEAVKSPIDAILRVFEVHNYPMEREYVQSAIDYTNREWNDGIVSRFSTPYKRGQIGNHKKYMTPADLYYIDKIADEMGCYFWEKYYK